MSALGVKLLLDTSYCVDLIRTRAHHKEAAFDRYAPGELAVSSITVDALEAYAQASSSPAQNQRALGQFLLPLIIVDFDAAAARLLARAGAQGQIAGDVHAALLAAHAQRLGATLVTRRPELYAGIPDLPLALDLDGESGRSETPTTASEIQPPQWRRPMSGPHTIVLTGSHDLSVDLLADELHAVHPGLVLAAAHVGSITGLLALRERTAHLAGSHLLDGASGEFNVQHVKELLTPYGVHVVIIGFVGRIQGLIVAPGNPRQISTLADLVRDDISFVNRQIGAGTRVLLDYHLQEAEINARQIAGYEQEATTHLAVATAVAHGRADCGLGIQAAAQTMGLDFVPLFNERYDLIIPVENYESALLAPMLALLRRPDARLRQRIAALGGYDMTPMGRVMAEV